MVGDQIVVDGDGLGSVDHGKHSLGGEQFDTVQELGLIEGVVLVQVHAIKYAHSRLGDFENDLTRVEGVIGFLFGKNAIVVQVIAIERGQDSTTRHIVEHVDLCDCLDKVVALHFCQITIHVVRVESLPVAIEIVLRNEVRIYNILVHFIGVLATDQVSVADIMPADLFEDHLTVAVLVNDGKESFQLRLGAHLQKFLHRRVIDIDRLDSDRYDISETFHTSGTF